MKKSLLLVPIVLFVIVTRAQPPKPPTIEERLKRTNEVIQQDVQPTAAQKAAIEQAFKTFFIAADQLHKDNPPPPPPPPDPKVKEQMDKLVKERDERIKKILTEDQYKKYQEAEKTLRLRSGPPPPPPTNK